MVTIPIPIIGPIIGALGGGALGAFTGAFIGETAIGRDMPQSVAAGKGALWAAWWVPSASSASAP